MSEAPLYTVSRSQIEIPPPRQLFVQQTFWMHGCRMQMHPATHHGSTRVNPSEAERDPDENALPWRLTT